MKKTILPISIFVIIIVIIVALFLFIPKKISDQGCLPGQELYFSNCSCQYVCAFSQPQSDCDKMCPPDTLKK